MLLMTRRPSATISGMAEKSDSSSTSLATWLAACAPLAMATEQFASFMASTSLTPSPVMATVCPSFRYARISRFFWSGVTRPKTVYSFAACRKSLSVSSVDASMYRSALGMPARRATSDTVMGLSPEMTLMETPCFAK